MKELAAAPANALQHERGSLTLATRWPPASPSKPTTEDPAKSRERRHPAQPARSNVVRTSVKYRRNHGQIRRNPQPRGPAGRRAARPGGRAARSGPQPSPSHAMSSSSPRSLKKRSAPARSWNGIACAGRSNWSSNASSPWRNWATCPSTTTRAPAPGFTENSLWRCWWTSWSVTPAPFPPGDTTWRRRRPHSPWREFRFVLNQVRRAIEPPLGLTRTIDEWNDISKALSEPPRRRRLQRAFHFNQ